MYTPPAVDWGGYLHRREAPSCATENVELPNEYDQKLSKPIQYLVTSLIEPLRYHMVFNMVGRHVLSLAVLFTAPGRGWRGLHGPQRLLA